MYDRNVSEKIKYEQRKGSSVDELPFLFYKNYINIYLRKFIKLLFRFVH